MATSLPAHSQIINGNFESVTGSGTNSTQTMTEIEPGVFYGNSDKSFSGWTLNQSAHVYQRSNQTTNRYALMLNSPDQSGSPATGSLNVAVAGSYNIFFTSFTNYSTILPPNSPVDTFADSVTQNTQNPQTSVTIGSQSLNFSELADNSTTVHLFNVNLEAGNHAITFTNNGTITNSAVFIDNLSVSPVPEPTSAILLGIGGLSLLLRRKK